MCVPLTSCRRNDRGGADARSKHGQRAPVMHDVARLAGPPTRLSPGHQRLAADSSGDTCTGQARDRAPGLPSQHRGRALVKDRSGIVGVVRVGGAHLRTDQHPAQHRNRCTRARAVRELGASSLWRAGRRPRGRAQPDRRGANRSSMAVSRRHCRRLSRFSTKRWLILWWGGIPPAGWIAGAAGGQAIAAPGTCRAG
jgi:hypothetical protein